MQTRYPANSDDPITSTEAFIRTRSEASRKRDWQAFDRNLPHILISHCPFCDSELWMKAGLMFSLTDNFWFRAYSDGRGDVVDARSVCKHLFCVDGALNLNGHDPLEARKWHSSDMGEDWDYIWMASEVPFVKPRVMSLPGMVAVMSDFTVEDRYTAYPIAYFSEERLYPEHRDEFCIPWAAKIYMDNHGSGYYLSGRREDIQDYDLKKWIGQRKLFWFDTHTNSQTSIHAEPDVFPYIQIMGRQHPYRIVEGKVFDLPKRDQAGEFSFNYSD